MSGNHCVFIGQYINGVMTYLKAPNDSNQPVTTTTVPTWETGWWIYSKDDNQYIFNSTNQPILVSSSSQSLFYYQEKNILSIANAPRFDQARWVMPQFTTYNFPVETLIQNVPSKGPKSTLNLSVGQPYLGGNIEQWVNDYTVPGLDGTSRLFIGQCVGSQFQYLKANSITSDATISLTTDVGQSTSWTAHTVSEGGKTLYFFNAENSDLSLYYDPNKNPPTLSIANAPQYSRARWVVTKPFISSTPSDTHFPYQVYMRQFGEDSSSKDSRFINLDYPNLINTEPGALWVGTKPTSPFTDNDIFTGDVASVHYTIECTLNSPTPNTQTGLIDGAQQGSFVIQNIYSTDWNGNRLYENDFSAFDLGLLVDSSKTSDTGITVINIAQPATYPITPVEVLTETIRYRRTFPNPSITLETGVKTGKTFCGNKSANVYYNFVVTVSPLSTKRTNFLNLFFLTMRAQPKYGTQIRVQQKIGDSITTVGIMTNALTNASSTTLFQDYILNPELFEAPYNNVNGSNPFTGYSYRLNGLFNLVYTSVTIESKGNETEMSFNANSTTTNNSTNVQYLGPDGAKQTVSVQENQSLLLYTKNNSLTYNDNIINVVLSSAEWNVNNSKRFPTYSLPEIVNTSSVLNDINISILSTDTNYAMIKLNIILENYKSNDLKYLKTKNYFYLTPANLDNMFFTTLDVQLVHWYAGYSEGQRLFFDSKQISPPLVSTFDGDEASSLQKYPLYCESDLQRISSLFYENVCIVPLAAIDSPVQLSFIKSDTSSPVQGSFPLNKGKECYLSAAIGQSQNIIAGINSNVQNFPYNITITFQKDATVSTQDVINFSALVYDYTTSKVLYSCGIVGIYLISVITSSTTSILLDYKPNTLLTTSVLIEEQALVTKPNSSTPDGLLKFAQNSFNTTIPNGYDINANYVYWPPQYVSITAPATIQPSSTTWKLYTITLDTSKINSSWQGQAVFSFNGVTPLTVNVGFNPVTPSFVFAAGSLAPSSSSQSTDNGDDGDVQRIEFGTPFSSTPTVLVQSSQDDLNKIPQIVIHQTDRFGFSFRKYVLDKDHYLQNTVQTTIVPANKYDTYMAVLQDPTEQNKVTNLQFLVTRKDIGELESIKGVFATRVAANSGQLAMALLSNGQPLDKSIQSTSLNYLDRDSGDLAFSSQCLTQNQQLPSAFSPVLFSAPSFLYLRATEIKRNWPAVEFGSQITNYNGDAKNTIVFKNRYTSTPSVFITLRSELTIPSDQYLGYNILETTTEKCVFTLHLTTKGDQRPVFTAYTKPVECYFLVASPNDFTFERKF